MVGAHYLSHLRTKTSCLSTSPSSHPLRLLDRSIVTADMASLLPETFEPFHGAKLVLPPQSHPSSNSWTQITCKVLDEMPEPDNKSCNAMIRNHTADRRYHYALSLFTWMLGVKLSPDCFSFAAAIKSSAASLSDAGLGKSFHGFAVKGGYEMVSAVQKALMGMYARFGLLRDSHRVFEDMGLRDSVSWNVLLTGYARARLHMEALDVFRSMHACDDGEVRPTAITIALVLPICAKLRIVRPGQSVHGYAIKTGLESETLVENALVSMYAKCGCVMDDAHTVFRLIACKDVISWNSMIAGFTENGLFAEALGLFCQMVSMNFPPNYATVANVLPICSSVDNGWFHGKEIHGYVLRSSLETDLSVCNALVTHYSKAGDMKGAESIFRNMHSRDLVTWNAVINGYAMNGWLLRALDSFHDLLSGGIKPDSITLISVLPVCAQMRDVREGRKIHDYVLHHPTLCQETSLGNALISFYGKCGELDDALRAFKGIKRKDLISWNAMLTAYADNRHWEMLIGLLNQMNCEGIKPDSVTILSILQACSFLGLSKVREVHGYSFRASLGSKLTVGNAILDAYAKCGSLESASRTFICLTGKNVITSNAMISGFLKHGCQEDAEKIFDQMYEKDLTTWNLMIQVYAQNDHIDQALSLFHELQDEGMRPDTVSIVSILAACARLASVRLVRQCHSYTIRTSIHDLHLEGALLDTYAKCGCVNDAHKLFRASPQKDLVIFTAMVGGYAMHGMAKEALGIFSEMIDLDIKPDHVILTTILSACSHSGLVDEGRRHFKSINEIHGIEPTMEHYTCMVDLLARGGRLREAYDFIMDMPREANVNVWGTLLGACKIHGEVEIGGLVADRLFDVEAGNIGNYVVMSNIYAADGRWDGVERVRKLMKSKDLRKPAGCSWIEVERTRQVFVAGDLSHPHRSFIYNMLRSLDQQMKVPSVQRA